MGNIETAGVIVFKLFLYVAAASSVHHILQSFCFHLWAINNKSNVADFTRNLYWGIWKLNVEIRSTANHVEDLWAQILNPELER